MTNEELSNKLEMNEMEYLDSILEQLQENLDYLMNTLGKYEKTGEIIDLKCFAIEFRRLSKRHDVMLNLSRSMLDEMSDSVEVVKGELMKKEVSDD